jgi:hypothetical protein
MALVARLANLTTMETGSHGQPSKTAKIEMAQLVA